MPASRFWRAVQSLSLAVKLVLAVISATLYWLAAALAETFHWDPTIAGITWAPHLSAVIFGALVMSPYAAASRRRPLRMVAMCVASVMIYESAMRFAINGHALGSTLSPFVIAGGAAAMLVGIAVTLLAPRGFHWALLALTLPAGAIGGAVFEAIPWGASDLNLIVGHYAWQVLVCLALHFGLGSRPANSLSAKH